MTTLQILKRKEKKKQKTKTKQGQFNPLLDFSRLIPD